MKNFSSKICKDNAMIKTNIIKVLILINNNNKLIINN